MKCNQSWNTDNCQPFKFDESDGNISNAPLLYGGWWDEDSQRLYNDPPTEYNQALYYFDGTNAGSLSLTWLLLLTPLVLGPKSLVKSFMVAFPAAMIFNFVLIIRAITLPMAGQGILASFHPNFDTLFRMGYGWEQIKNMLMGNWFLSFWGCLIYVGKHVDQKKSALPYLIISGLVFFTSATLNVIKVGAFQGFFQDTMQRNPMTPQWSVGWSWHNYEKNSIPVLLSRLAGSNFWLIINFSYHLCTILPSSCLILEMIASSLAEILPNAWSERTKFPRNMLVTGILGLLGFSLSMIILRFPSLGKGDYLFAGISDTFTLTFFVAVAFIMIAILPLILSKVFNTRHEDLLSFALRQKSSLFNIPSLLVKITLVVGVIVGGILNLLSGADIIVMYMHNLAYGRIWTILSFCLVLLVILLAFIVKTILHIGNRDGHPCCVALGPSLEKEGDLVTGDDEVELKPLHG